MVNENAHLASAILAPDTLEQSATRDGFGMGVVAAGDADPRVVVLCADLAESTRSHWFREKFPERYVEVGVAEQNLAALAAGMAAAGKIPFIASYAAFSPGRNWEQIRTTVCLNEMPVKVMGMHAGVSVGPDGATHQALEDIAIMRVLPRMTVIAPCDALEARKAVEAAAKTDGPVYIRFHRAKTPVFTTRATPFAIGKAYLVWESDNPEVAVFACGPLVYEAVRAAAELAHEGIDTVVVNNHTVKPMDEPLVIEVARRAGAVVTVEEHQVSGGMGGAVAEVLMHNAPVPLVTVGVHDQFGQSGTPEELMRHYGMDVASIKEAIRAALARKEG